MLLEHVSGGKQKDDGIYQYVYMYIDIDIANARRVATPG